MQECPETPNSYLERSPVLNRAKNILRNQKLVDQHEPIIKPVYRSSGKKG